MLKFFLLFIIFPIGIGVALIIAAILIRLRREKDPRFDQWLKEVWPNEIQREAIVTAIIIILFLMYVLKTGVTF